jgi:N-formylglutamate amidohydrolase
MSLRETLARAAAAGADEPAAAESAPEREPPFDLRRPSGPGTPVIFASPHSGRLYPADLMSASRLDTATVRRSEDAFVDVLIGEAPAAGVTVLSARYARAYMDVNREPYELDPAMFSDELPAFAQARTARVAAGLGSIARVVGEGQEIYARKLTFAEARRRIETVHQPYHEALARLLEETRRRHGCAVLVDWHSMPSAAASEPGRTRRGPDMVLGDRYGAACSPLVTSLVERELTAMGYLVDRNRPYAGGWTTEHYGAPGKRTHALQIEINRALYLDEAKLERHEGYERLRRDLTRLTAALAAADWRRLA